MSNLDVIRVLENLRNKALAAFDLVVNFVFREIQVEEAVPFGDT